MNCKNIKLPDPILAVAGLIGAIFNSNLKEDRETLTGYQRPDMGAIRERLSERLNR